MAIFKAPVVIASHEITDKGTFVEIKILVCQINGQSIAVRYVSQLVYVITLRQEII